VVVGFRLIVVAHVAQILEAIDPENGDIGMFASVSLEARTVSPKGVDEVPQIEANLGVRR